MIGLPLWEQWDGKVDKCAYAWFTTLTEKRWKRMCIASHGKRQLAIRMNGIHTTISCESTKRFAMQSMNGLGTMMAMVFEKYTPTPPKACGQMFVITCAVSKAFTKII